MKKKVKQQEQQEPEEYEEEVVEQEQEEPQLTVKEKRMNALAKAREKLAEKQKLQNDYKNAVKIDKKLKEEEQLKKIEEVKNKILEKEQKSQKPKRVRKQVIKEVEEEDDDDDEEEEPEPVNYKKIIHNKSNEIIKRKLENEKYKKVINRPDDVLERALKSLNFF